MDSNIELINLLWGIVVVPIKLLYDAWKEKRKQYEKLKDTVKTLETEVKTLNGKLIPLSADIKELTKEISKAELEMEKRLMGLKIESMQKRGNNNE